MSKKIGAWFRLNYRNVIIGALIVVPFLVSLISTIHVVNFFKLSNFNWLAVTLAIAFEVGALSSLAALAVMDKISKFSLWLIFILITIMQMMGNTYYAFDFMTTKMTTHPEWTQNWIDLFSINGEGLPATKRILAIVSGAILPVISLTFLHILISYISSTKPKSEEEIEYEYITVDENGNEVVIEEPVKQETVVSIPFVSTDEDRNTQPTKEPVYTTNVSSEGYINANEVIKDREIKDEPEKTISPKRALSFITEKLQELKSNPEMGEELSTIKTTLENLLQKRPQNPQRINLPRTNEISNDVVIPETTDIISPDAAPQPLNINQPAKQNYQITMNFDDDVNIIPLDQIESTITDIDNPATEIIEQPEIPIIKDQTFQTNEDEFITETDDPPQGNELTNLNGTIPTKKKILLYKEKKN